MLKKCEKVPEPLNRQFPQRLGKDDAIHNKEKKEGQKRARSELFPPGKLQQLTTLPCIFHCLANLLVSDFYFAGSVQLKVCLVAIFSMDTPS